MFHIITLVELIITNLFDLIIIKSIKTLFPFKTLVELNVIKLFDLITLFLEKGFEHSRATPWEIETHPKSNVLLRI